MSQLSQLHPDTGADVSSPTMMTNEEAKRASDGGAEDAVNNTAAMTMDIAEDEEDLFNSGATTTMAGQSSEIPAQPSLYIALSERAPAQVKVTTILTFRR